jgi:hypothetical protein
MIGNGIMIGQAQNLVAKCFIGFLYFFSGQFSVGDVTVGMQVCFEVLGHFG